MAKSVALESQSSAESMRWLLTWMEDCCESRVIWHNEHGGTMREQVGAQHIPKLPVSTIIELGPLSCRS